MCWMICLLHVPVSWKCSCSQVAHSPPISVAFGPNLKIGDIITVEVDVPAKTVSFRRNQAFVGLAFGPAGSGAALEHRDVSSESPPGVDASAPRPPAWPEHDWFHAAVTLTHTKDAVELVTPPPSASLLSLSLAGTGGNGSGEGWLGLVRESLGLLSAVTNRELPGTFVSKELLPKVTMLPSCRRIYHRQYDYLRLFCRMFFHPISTAKQRHVHLVRTTAIVFAE